MLIRCDQSSGAGNTIDAVTYRGAGYFQKAAGAHLEVLGLAQYLAEQAWARWFAPQGMLIEAPQHFALRFDLRRVTVDSMNMSPKTMIWLYSIHITPSLPRRVAPRPGTRQAYQTALLFDSIG